MIGAHIVLHLGLCNAMLKLPEGATTKVHVRMLDRLSRPHVDQDFTVKRLSDPTVHLEFDSPPGSYGLEVSAPQYRCYASDIIVVIDQHNRTVNEQLSDGAPVAGTRPMLIDGTAPPSFLYLSPTYVLFDKTTQCDKPVPDPIPVRETIENDQDSFYIWLYSDPSLVARGPEIVALQLQTATGEDHYIRIKVPFPLAPGGLGEVQFNVTDDEITWLSGQPTGVLLCPKLFRTSAG
ncbi:MAG: hypothetical protein WBG27_02685 [Candidatus Aquilonibacter sp.]|jgi:hypothetical protein